MISWRRNHRVPRSPFFSTHSPPHNVFQAGVCVCVWYRGYVNWHLAQAVAFFFLCCSPPTSTTLQTHQNLGTHTLFGHFAGSGSFPFAPLYGGFAWSVREGALRFWYERCALLTELDCSWLSGLCVCVLMVASECICFCSETFDRTQHTTHPSWHGMKGLLASERVGASFSQHSLPAMIAQWASAKRMVFNFHFTLRQTYPLAAHSPCIPFAVAIVMFCDASKLSSWQKLQKFGRVGSKKKQKTRAPRMWGFNIFNL